MARIAGRKLTGFVTAIGLGCARISNSAEGGAAKRETRGGSGGESDGNVLGGRDGKREGGRFIGESDERRRDGRGLCGEIVPRNLNVCVDERTSPGGLELLDRERNGLRFPTRSEHSATRRRKHHCFVLVETGVLFQQTIQQNLLKSQFIRDYRFRFQMKCSRLHIMHCDR